MVGLVLTPPEMNFGFEGKLIFLAGPIQGAPDWQGDAIKYIRRIDNQVHIASPRRVGPNYREGEFSAEMYHEQVLWEYAHLSRAARDGAILFWLGKELKHDCSRAYAQTTRVEFGYWLARHEIGLAKIVVGIGKGFSGKKYPPELRAILDLDFPILGNLEETCRAAVEQCYSPKNGLLNYLM